jgi:peptide/nickel transport system substrate-binding protein
MAKPTRPRSGRISGFAVAGLALALVVTACRGQDSSSPTSLVARVEQEQPAAQSAPPQATKRITSVIRGSPKVLSVAIDSAGAGQTKGLSEVEQLVNVGLGVVDNTGDLHPRLAEAVPSIENGGWKVFPDGRMETTWSIKPNAAWHDGTPFTADDLVFTSRVAQDKSLALVLDRAFDSVESIEARDPRTLVVTWTEPYIDADRLFSATDTTSIVPMPRHLLEQAFTEDRGSFLELPYWSASFVGTGPFRLAEWVPDSHLVLAANPDYVHGKPKIDEIEVRFIGDANVTVANVLADALDVTLRAGLSFEQGRQIREAWQGGKVVGSFSALPTLFPQFINPNPTAVADVRFRRALTRAMDRRELSETFAGGTPVGHSPITPGSSEHRAVERDIVVHDFDPRASIQLLESLGYVRGADGVFRDRGQEKLSVAIQSTTDDLREKLMLAIRDYWLKVGVDVEPVIVPRQASKDRQLRATFSAFDFTVSPSVPTRLHSSAIPLPENGFSGHNRTRYSNPEMDALIEKYFVTIRKQERMQVLSQMVHHQTDQLVTIGLFFLEEPTVVGNRLANFMPPKQRNGSLSWNAHAWDIK